MLDMKLELDDYETQLLLDLVRERLEDIKSNSIVYGDAATQEEHIDIFSKLEEKLTA